MGGQHAVAGGDRVTVAACRQILQAGGNAFDAAVGGVFAAMVAEPTLTSPGGSGVLMALPLQGRSVVYDFFADMPRCHTAQEEVDFFGIIVDFGPAQQEFHIGRGAAAVPGNVIGLFQVHQELGRMPRAEVLAPAISAARQGVTLSAMQGYLVRILAPILTHEAEGRALFAPGGQALKEGSLLKNPQLADFLEALATEGADLFYRGEVARQIVEWARPGGLISERDLALYKVEKRMPLKVDFAGHQILLNPPPAQSGVLMARTFALLERFAPDGRISSPHLARALEKTDQRRAGVLPGSTTHLSVLDRQGNAASVTTTNGEGCGYMLPGTGFMINNMLGEEDLNPGGFFRYSMGQRLATMLAPTLVLEGDRTVLLSGSAGSKRIRSVVVQVIVNVLCRGMDLQEATDAPRLHLEGETLHFEPNLQGLDGLPYRFHPWPELNLYFGGANSVTPEDAAGDPRRHGHGEVFD